jgi:hypothetical protein
MGLLPLPGLDNADAEPAFRSEEMPPRGSAGIIVPAELNVRMRGFELTRRVPTRDEQISPHDLRADRGFAQGLRRAEGIERSERGADAPLVRPMLWRFEPFSGAAR